MSPTIVFDIGSTLIHPDIDVLISHLGKKFSDVDKRLVAQAFSYALEADLRTLPLGGDRATRQGLEFLRMLDSSGYSDPAVARDIWLRIQDSGGAASPLYTQLDPDALIVLTTLQSAGCILIAASNSNGTLRAELDSFGLLDYFNQIFDSHDIGFEKPDESFFSKVLLHLKHISPFSHNWYVGNDLFRDVLGSLLAGFDHAVFYDHTDAYTSLTTQYRITKLCDLPRIVLPPTVNV